MQVLYHILLLSVSIFLIAKMLPGVHIKSFFTSIIVAVVYSIVDFLLGWLLTMLSIPFIFITLGLFTFVINAVLLWITDKIIEDFKIDGIGQTLLAALLITILNSILNWIF